MEIYHTKIERRIYIVGFKSKDDYDKFQLPEPILLEKTIADILDNDVKQKKINITILMKA